MSEIRKAVTILRRPEVQARIGLSRSTLYKMMDEGTFPRAVSLGARSIGWKSCDIDHWLENRPVKS
jgi:prophage regulatory protein